MIPKEAVHEKQRRVMAGAQSQNNRDNGGDRQTHLCSAHTEEVAELKPAFLAT